LPHSVSVIIVTWDALKHLRTFLPSVTKTEYKDFEIIIADNASTDGSAEWVRNNYPECSIVTYPQNYGYCGGNNRAAEYARGDILLFLNNDVEVQADWLQHLSKVFEDPEVAAAQPKIRSYLDREYFEYSGAAGGYLDRFGYPFCRGRLFHTLEKDEGQYDSPVPVFWATGAAFAIRKKLFLEFERFDEEFKFHMEEIDLCWRLLNRGYRIQYCPQSVVFHLGGGSLPMDSSVKTFYNFRNSLMMLWKNASTGWLKKHFFPRLLLDVAAAIYALMKGNIKDTSAIFKAHINFYTRWHHVHEKRKKLQAIRKHPNEPEEMKDVFLIREYFIRRKKRYNEIIS